MIISPLIVGVGIRSVLYSGEILLSGDGNDALHVIHKVATYAVVVTKLKLHTKVAAAIGVFARRVSANNGRKLRGAILILARHLTAEVVEREAEQLVIGIEVDTHIKGFSLIP